MFTGQAAHNHGIQSNAPQKRDAWWAFKDKEDSTLPLWLKAQGYSTGLIGKYINGYGKDDKRRYKSASKKRGTKAADNRSFLTRWADYFYERVWSRSDPVSTWMPKGWDLWYAFAGGVSYYDYTINENGNIIEFDDKPEDYSTHVLGERAVSFIKDQAQAKNPFFLFIAPKAVHGQGQGERDEHGRKKTVKSAIPAPQYEQAFLDVKLPVRPVFDGSKTDLTKMENDYRAALRALQSVDDLVEAVVNALKDTGQLDNSLIIYTSDNGFLFGQHGKRGKGGLFEGAIRVPLVLRGPKIPKKEIRGQLVNNLDVVATIVNLAGATPDLVADGRSLDPLFADANAPWRSAILIQRDDQSGVRTLTRKYVRNGRGAEGLYDLSTDPDELKDKANDPAYADDLAKLRGLVQTLATCVGPTCWVP